MNDLEKLRTSRGLTQEDVASRVGIAVSTYSMYANGHRSIPRLVAERIAAVLECDVEAIFLVEKFTVSKNNDLFGRAPPGSARESA